MMNNVVISGMGIVSSIGDNVLSFCDSLKAGKSGIHKCLNLTEPKVSMDIAAKIEHFSFIDLLNRFQDIPEEKIQKAGILGKRAPFPIQTSIIAAMESWQNARLFTRKIENDRIGVVIAGQNSTQNYQYELIPKFKKNPEYLSPRYALEFLETNQIGVLSDLFEIHGEGLVVGGASATGNVGIIKGYELVKSGVIDACLVVGVIADLSPMDVQGFINIGAMGGKKFFNEPEKACRPFDSLHEGFIYGQACAALILESELSARKRAVDIFAEIAGTAINLDGNSSANPDVRGEIKAMTLALKRSNLSTNQVDYLNSHGSSSPLGDDTEAEAIHQVFGNHSCSVFINSTKGLTGHCLYSAGVVEAIATVLQMQHSFVHSNKNLESPIRTDLRFAWNETIYQNLNIALSNSFGFGGVNTSIVLVNR